jgi:hypothetical protein
MVTSVRDVHVRHTLTMKYPHIALLTLIVAMVPGCSSRDNETAPVVGTAAEAVTTNVDLISTGTCKQHGGRLVSCQVGPDTLTGVPFTTAVPLRTVLTPTKSGNCSSQYPLQLTATADDGSSVTLAYLSATNAYLRRADGNAMASSKIADSSPWTSVASFDPTCSIQLGVTFNQVDVDTAAQAQQIITNWQAALTSAETVASNYHDLLLYQQAYQFMSSVAQNFYVQLTNDTMQQLRAAGSAASNALLTLITDCNVGLSQQDQMNLVQLYSTLPVLGLPSAWEHPDGGLLTIADIIGPTAASVLQTINQISAAHNLDAGTGYDVDYQQAEQAVIAAQAQLALAEQQLAPWFTDGGLPDAGRLPDGGAP